MHRLLIALFLTSLALVSGVACASPQNAWQRYQAFSAELDAKGEATDYSAQLSKRLREVLSQAAPEELKELKASAAYPRWLKSEHSHFEKAIEGGGACLTVNGIAQDGSRSIVAVAFVREPDGLQADDIFYRYLEAGETFAEAARCPSEFELKFP